MTQSKSLTILDKDYIAWVKQLCERYRASQIKAAIKVNTEMIKYYWDLGRDITMRDDENRYGSAFYPTLSRDLKAAMPDVSGLSASNIRYAKRFYDLFSGYFQNLQQVVENLQTVDNVEVNTTSENVQQLVEKFDIPIFEVPWGHHTKLVDKFSEHPEKAVFFARETVKNGWSRDTMMNFIGTDLFERQGKALTNFKRTLPTYTSDLAQELTKDPYDFAFTGITKQYNERILKDALLSNISQFLVELGTGFAYVGKEYRLQVGSKEKFIDLLFYNLNLSAYVVVEVKIGELDFADIGQLSGYVVACNHLLRKEGRDNPTIGILICREKDAVVAKYALEGSNLPLGISEYELSKLYPEKIEGTVPTIEDLERRLLDEK